MQIVVEEEQRSKLRTLSVLECPHATEFRVFDYSECQEICSVCGKVIGTISYSPLDHFLWLWASEEN